MTERFGDRSTPASASSTDERIIEAVLTLIARDGLGAVTMVKVAETAGISRQTLYNHYPDVDSIITEAIGRHNRESIRLLEASMRIVSDPQGRLEQLVRHAASIGAHAHRVQELEHGLSADARVALREYDDAHDRWIQDVLEQGRQSGAFRGDLVPGVDAVLVRHMLRGVAEASAEAPEETAAIAAAGLRTVVACVCRR